ncbi:monocarboxylate transporter 12-like [Mercenaria mercenaria]|uniref:monocarboxylate transporter 12-like n=1 Tax=Mercenaria mercenaria TaxID=6596 RepID=UPI00234EC89D|nr:monocarboxylate transporter 12-like [Mercenaria mercenaria]
MSYESNVREATYHSYDMATDGEDAKLTTKKDVGDSININIAKEVVKCSENERFITAEEDTRTDPGKGDNNIRIVVDKDIEVVVETDYDTSKDHEADDNTGTEVTDEDDVLTETANDTRKDPEEHDDNITTEVADENEVFIETDDSKRKAPDGGWGWMIVFGCLLMRTVTGGFTRSSGLFYVKFSEKFGESAAKTAWVTSLSVTVRLLIGPCVSILCNRFSCRKLTYFGSGIFVVAVHISAYANSLEYLYFSYGVLGGLGRSFILTPLTMLLGEYFDKRRSLAFGLASAGFGIGGFAITPTIELMFQEYGFRGTYILLSGIACHLFVCASLFRPLPKIDNRTEKTRQSEVKKRKDSETININDESANKDDFYVSSTGSVHLYKEDDEEITMIDQQRIPNGSSNDKVEKEDDKNKKSKTKKKLISFSVLKDIRFVTLCIATFINTLPSTGLFLPALAKSRGISDIQAAYLLSIIAGSDTVSRVIAGFVLDLKAVRDLRPYIYNVMSFIQCVALFSFPSLQSFKHFTAVCVLHGVVMGTKAAQRNVILVDILGVDKLSSSFAILLAVQGTGTLAGPPVSGFLKDTYGKYDYPFYFGGSCVLLGAIILASGNIRNYIDKRKPSPKD